MASEIAVAREFTDPGRSWSTGRLTKEEAAMVKWRDTELCSRAADRFVQVHGGYG